jgi:hypothetical protein
MGIGMRLYMAPDSDLYAFAGAPRTLQMWLRYPRSVPDVELHEHWKDLDAIVGAEPSAPSRSPLTPEGANLAYPTAADHGAHALSSTSTKHLLHAVEAVARPKVEAYVRQRWAAHVPQTGSLPDLAPEQVEIETDELLEYLGRLRQACTLAAGKGYGLLMALWEE